MGWEIQQKQIHLENILQKEEEGKEVCKEFGSLL